MKTTTIAFLVSVSLAVSLGQPATALAQQSFVLPATPAVEAVVTPGELSLTPGSEPESTPGVESSRLLRMPASLFALVSDDDQTPTSPLSAPQTSAAATSKGQLEATWKPAKISRVFVYALQMTFYEHVLRVLSQDFTRQQLKGKFWPEYFDSIHVPQKWGDKDHWQVNYIGHAISGGAFARIWMVQREPRTTTAPQYFKALGRALIFTSICSIQYEMGPMSEASIGNVGLNPDDLGWNDYIWTPVGGVLWTMAEDAIDKYALAWIDKHVPFMMAKAAARMILNPSRMLANIGMNRTPWSRYDRTMMGEPTGRR
jgi:hypothetical protein